MSALRGHRGARGRFLAVGGAVCLLVAVVYFYRVGTQRQDELQHCEADRRAVHAQLKAIVDYKERMEHSLSAEKTQHADSVASLQHQLKEQDKLAHRVESLQIRFDNTTKFCNVFKESLESQKKLLTHCQNDISHAASEKNKYEEKLLELTTLITTLQSENDNLHQRIQSMVDTHPPNPEPKIRTPPHNKENKNISRQIKLSNDSYYVPISSSALKVIAADNIRNVEKTPSNQRIISQLNVTDSSKNRENSVNKFGLNKPEIPLGVAPELPVDENINEKNMNFLAKPPDNKPSEQTFEKKPDGNPPNRYKVKLSQDEDHQLSNNKNKNPEFFNFVADKPIKKSLDIHPVHEDNLINNEKNKQKEVLSDADTKLEQDMKKDDPDDSNLSQNNGEPNNNNEIREDDDDMDEYGYPRVEAAEDPVNK